MYGTVLLYAGIYGRIAAVAAGAGEAYSVVSEMIVRPQRTHRVLISVSTHH